ncbi:hypothetical protein B0G84_9021 [Paraburkholderia sp. BL8N3]|nr:hypothetical protein [Paraburkholderia sp. BL8N3]TCK31912.1 hypothetical protein B0G84_9021 [Paraburkholderia sp. BL8N3]
MQNLEATPLTRDPLALAQLYFSGLGTSWRNQKEAAATLAHFKPKVSRNDLNRAVGVSKLPLVVLSLFEKAGIWKVTARKLASLARKHGIEVLEQRAKQIDPSGKTSSEITDLLDGHQPVPPKRRRRDSSSPLALAALYKDGLLQGRWTSLDSAAVASDVWSKPEFAKAVAISELPPRVLELFKGKPLSFALGEVLLRIQKVLGSAEMSERADAMVTQPRRLTSDQIVATFLRVMPGGGVDLKIRTTASGFVFQFHVDFDHSDEMIFCAEDLAPVIQMSLMSLRRKRLSGRR